MIKPVFIAVFIIITLLFIKYFFMNRDNSDKEIFRLLNSEQPKDLIIGAFQAGESKEKIFVPLLLKNANDPRVCADIKFKGFSVYQEKMIAIGKILNVDPPVEITNIPDSVIINFYIHAASIKN